MAAGMREAGNQTSPHRVVDSDHDDRHGRSEALRREHGGDRIRKDHTHTGLSQLACKFRELFIVSRRKAHFEYIVAALDQAVIA